MTQIKVPDGGYPTKAFSSTYSPGWLLEPSDSPAASTKASTLGTVLVLLGAVFYFWESGISARLFLVLLFIFGTAPVSAHMLGRAAYSDGVPLWQGTQFDELRDKFEDNIPTD